MAVEFGFAEVLPDRVTVIAQCAERAEEIDTERAETARKRAEGRLSTPAATIDIERARIALMKSLIRLQVAARARVRG
jgi:F-type H+-transporting ATPase subunit epsilon